MTDHKTAAESLNRGFKLSQRQGAKPAVTSGIPHIQLDQGASEELLSELATVTFGAGPPQLRPITWEKFHRAFLPKTDKIPDEFDLELMSVHKEEDIPAEGKNKIFVANVIAADTHQMHFRIFDAAGEKVVDKPPRSTGSSSMLSSALPTTR